MDVQPLFNVLNPLKNQGESRVKLNYSSLQVTGIVKGSVVSSIFCFYMDSLITCVSKTFMCEFRLKLY